MSKLIYRKVAEKDLPMLLEWRQDPDVCKYLPSIPGDMESQIKWWKSLDEHKKYFICNYDGVDSGIQALVNIDYNNKRLEIGGYIPSQYQGNKLGYISVSCIIHYVFEIMKFNKVYATIPIFNTRSIKATLHDGFEFEGVLKEWFYHDGKFHDDVILSVLRKNWKNNLQHEYVVHE